MSTKPASDQERSFYNWPMTILKDEDALILGIAYGRKVYLAALSNYTLTGTDSFRYNAIREYVWYKVAQSYSPTKRKNESLTIQLQELFELSRQPVTKNGWLKEADAMAKQIRDKADAIMEEKKRL